VFAAAALAHAGAAVLAGGISRTDVLRTPPSMGNAWRAVGDGARAAVADRGTALVIAVLTVNSAASGAVGVLLVVLPLELLGLGSSGVGFLLAVFALGGFGGGLAAAALAGGRRLAGPMGLGLALAALPLLVAAARPARAVVLLAVVVMGGGFAFASVVGTTLLVRTVRDDVLARVVGVVRTVRAIGIALAAGLTPVLLDAVGLRWTMLAIGAALVAVLLAVRTRLAAIDATSSVPEEQLALLLGTPVFAPLPPVALERLATRLEPVLCAAGTVVLQEGDQGSCVFLVFQGDLAVEASEAGGVVDRIGAGEVFGEMALLHDAHRNATVRAVSDCALYRLTREEFLAAVTGSPTSAVQAQNLVAGRLQHRRRVVDGT